MNKYTIRYQYGSYSGIRIVLADDQEEAISKMWRSLSKDMTLPMAHKSAKVIDTGLNNLCGECGCKIAAGENFCGECMCEDDCGY